MRAPIGPNLAWFMCCVLVCWFFSIIRVKSWRFSFGLNIEEITSFSTHLFLLLCLSSLSAYSVISDLYCTLLHHGFMLLSIVSNAAAAKRPFVSVLGAEVYPWTDLVCLFCECTVLELHVCLCAWVYCVKIVSIVDPFSHPLLRAHHHHHHRILIVWVTSPTLPSCTLVYLISSTRQAHSLVSSLLSSPLSLVLV